MIKKILAALGIIVFAFFIWPTPYSAPFGYVTKDSANVVRYNRITQGIDCYWWSDGVWRPWKKPAETGNHAEEKEKDKNKNKEELEKGTHSLHANIPTEVRFENQTGQTIKIYWLDYSGNRKLYKILPDKQAHIQATFVTHPWLITGEDEKVRQIIFPDSLRRTVVIRSAWQEGTTKTPEDKIMYSEELAKRAEAGDAEAQYALGVAYCRGQGVAHDFREAVKWYQKAAEQGHPDAQCNLGMHISKGEGTERDMKKAFMWWMKSSEKGNAKAQYMLGECFHEGRGVEKDEKQAVRWWIRSAAQGNVGAQMNVKYTPLEKLEKPTGLYLVEGENEDKSTYKGEFGLYNNEGRCEAIWKINNSENTEGTIFQGEGFIIGKYLCLYYSGPSRGAAFYEIQSNQKTLNGTWIGEDDKLNKRFIGKEKLVKKY